MSKATIREQEVNRRRVWLERVSSDCLVAMSIINGCAEWNWIDESEMHGELKVGGHPHRCEVQYGMPVIKHGARVEMILALSEADIASFDIVEE